MTSTDDERRPWQDTARERTGNDQHHTDEKRVPQATAPHGGPPEFEPRPSPSPAIDPESAQETRRFFMGLARRGMPWVGASPLPGSGGCGRVMVELDPNGSSPAPSTVLLRHPPRNDQRGSRNSPPRDRERAGRANLPAGLEPYLSTAELSVAINFSVSTIYRWRTDPDLDFASLEIPTPSGRVRWRLSAVQAWLEDRRLGARRKEPQHA